MTITGWDGWDAVQMADGSFSAVSAKMVRFASGYMRMQTSYVWSLYTGTPLHGRMEWIHAHTWRLCMRDTARTVVLCECKRGQLNGDVVADTNTRAVHSVARTMTHVQQHFQLERHTVHGYARSRRQQWCTVARVRGV